MESLSTLQQRRLEHLFCKKSGQVFVDKIALEINYFRTKVAGTFVHRGGYFRIVNSTVTATVGALILQKKRTGFCGQNQDTASAYTVGDMGAMSGVLNFGT